MRALGWVVVLATATIPTVIGMGGAPAAAGRPSQVSLPVPGSTSTTSTTTVASTTTTTISSTTTTPSTTTSTTVPANSSFSATLVPCGATSGPCNLAPTQVEASFSSAQPPAAVEINWFPAPDRPQNAPGPDETSVLLSSSAANTCNQPGTGPGGQQTACWDWPAGLRYQSRSILNGAYQIEGCQSDQSSACGQSNGGQPVIIGLAVPPPPARDARSSVSGKTVSITWQPPSSAPPDLAGYVVWRNGEPIYSCTLFNFGSRGNVPCPSPLQIQDQPGGGTWTYQVQSVRLGPGGQEPAVVGATTQTAAPPVTVSGPKSTVTSSAGGSDLPPVPVVGAFAGLYAVSSIGPAPRSGSLPGEGDSGPAGGTVKNLTYPSIDNSAVGADGSPAREPGPSGPDVVPAGMVAIALLVLTLAAHLLVLRGLVDARRLRNGKVG